MALPYRTTGSLKPTFVSARLVGLAVNLVYAFAIVGLISKQPEPSFARLRYRLGGDRPSQTTRLPLSLSRITGVGFHLQSNSFQITPLRGWQDGVPADRVDRRTCPC